MKQTAAPRKYIFSQRIIRFLAFFMAILVIYSTTQIVVEHYLIKKLRYQNEIVSRQQAKRKLGDLIKERILQLDLNFKKSLLSENVHEIRNLDQENERVTASIKELLPILQHGGTYTHTISVNLNTTDEVEDKIDYRKDGDAPPFYVVHGTDDIVVEVIDILPKVEELEILMVQIRQIRTRLRQLSDNQASQTVQLEYDELKQQLNLYVLQADTLMQRCIENSNKIFFDATQELETLTRERDELINQFDTIRKYFYIVLQAVIMIMFLFVFIRITQILKSARQSEKENQSLLERLKDANSVLEEIVSNLPVGIVLVSSEKKILQVNSEAERILGYAPGEGEKYLKGKVCHSNYCTLGEMACPIYDLNMPKVVLKERTAIKKGKEHVSILKSVMPIRLKGEEVLLEAFMDLSAIKQAETAMLEAKNAAESANLAKSGFLANMSHEIRTPMNAIIGFSELLLKEETDPGQRKQLRMIYDSANALLKIINEILDFSKIEAGKMQIEVKPFSVHSLLDRIRSIFSISANEKGLSLNVSSNREMPQLVSGDELRLRQILVNIIGNAIKFTESGSIEVLAEYQSPNLIFRITDTGIGIPQTRMEDIFNTFEQLDSRTERQYGGSGLGLSISRSLVRLMGGAIHVESMESKGTTFTITLPMTEAEELHGSGKPEMFSEEAWNPYFLPRPLKCLVVDDNPVNTLLAKKQLKRLNVESDSAENGKAALEKLQAATYDFILLDMHMPVMNGMETIKAIREDDRLKTLPVIASTADALKGSDQVYLNAGCRAYLSKPLEMSKLKRVIYELFSHFSEAENTPENADDSSSEKLNEKQDPISESEAVLLKETIAVLKNNCNIFNPDELQEMSEKLKTGSKQDLMTRIADEIYSAAAAYEDTGLKGMISKLETILENKG